MSNTPLTVSNASSECDPKPADDESPSPLENSDPNPPRRSCRSPLTNSLTGSLLSKGVDVASILAKKTVSTSSEPKLQAKPAPPLPRPPPEKPFSDGVLSQSITLTDHIFGIYGLELWQYKESNGTLVNIPLNDDISNNDEETGKGNTNINDGLYVKRIPQEIDPDNDYATDEAKHAYAQLTDKSRSDYIHPIPTGPGVGLPGVLWSETSSGGNNESGRSLGNSQKSGKSFVSHLSHRNVGGNQKSTMNLAGAFSKGSSSHVVWRDVNLLANDPDQPYDERLQCFAKAGFDLAAGVPFDINGYRGIAIFFGNKHADKTKLNDTANILFMRQAAFFIGAAASLKKPLEDAKAFKERVQYENWHRMKIKLLTIVRFGGSLRKNAASASSKGFEEKKSIKRRSSMEIARAVKENFKETAMEAKDNMKLKFARWWVKIHGGNAGIPPSFTYTQAMWTFFGVVVTHFILSRLNLLISTESQGDLDLVLPPLGALTTLQYALTAAPASQPRNAFFAQVFGVTVAMLIGMTNLEPWIKSALAPAIVIPGMAKLGIIHPPAGAACIVFSSGKKSWEHMGIFLAGVCIAITTSVVINNLCDKRQYPTSWPLLNKAKKRIIPPKE